MERRRLVELFLGESRDHLSAAYETLEGLEEGEGSSDALCELMRHAHSLKGMAMSLGFSPMEALAHALEDLFESLDRASPQRLRALTPLVLDGLSCLGGIVDSVEQEGEAAENGARELAALIRAAERQGIADPSPGADDAAAQGEPDPVASPEPASGPQRWKIELLLYTASRQTATQTVAVLRSLDGLGRVEHVDPPLAAGQTGRFEGRLVLILRSDADRQELERGLREMPEVACFNVQPLPAREDGQRRGAGPVRWARVRADLLDSVLDKAADLVHEHRRARVSSCPEEMELHLERSEFLLKELYGALSELRMVPFQTLLQRLDQTVHEVARELARPVRFRVEGAGIRLDRSVLDGLLDPLRHMIRNALDHGVEPPDERRRAGKPAEATIRLRVERRGEWIRIALEDDGRGLDADALRQGAVQRGLLDEPRAAALSDAEAYQLASLPSLSTISRPTRFSGRGVGLDVVRENVERLGGRISIDSSPGRGTRVELALPLTLALIQALLVRSAGQLFALPVTRIRTSLDWKAGPAAGAPAGAGGAEPVRLDEWLGLERAGQSSAARTALLLEAGGGSIGILVDEVLGRREVVVRPLGPPLNSLLAYSGAALLEDGSIVLVLDPESIVAGRSSGQPRRSGEVLVD